MLPSNFWYTWAQETFDNLKILNFEQFRRKQSDIWRRFSKKNIIADTLWTTIRSRYPSLLHTYNAIQRSEIRWALLPFIHFLINSCDKVRFLKQCTFHKKNVIFAICIRFYVGSWLCSWISVVWVFARGMKKIILQLSVSVSQVNFLIFTLLAGCCFECPLTAGCRLQHRSNLRSICRLYYPQLTSQKIEKSISTPSKTLSHCCNASLPILAICQFECFAENFLSVSEPEIW